MSDLVEPNLKPDPEPCVCGCGLVAALRRKAWRDGLGPHVRSCRCVSCRNAGNRTKGLRKQREARKALGIAPNRTPDSNEENWADALFANEVKSGKQCGPVWNWWLRVEAQVHANRPDFGGQHKPTRAVAMPEGTSRGLVVVTTDTWRDLIRPALEEVYGP